MNRHIVLFNDGVLPTYLVIHYKPNDHYWDIKEIEMYADEQLQSAICDAITLEQLPTKTRTRLIAALNKAQSRSTPQDVRQKRHAAVPGPSL
jgi:hypothetical protein